MTTVILTPTHIAQDHCVVNQCEPPRTTVDLGHKKIFLPKHKKFVIGTSGIYNPTIIDRKETYVRVAEIITSVINDLKLCGTYINLVDKEFKSFFIDTFDSRTIVLIVTKQHRFSLIHSKELDELIVKYVNDFTGMGSGAGIAKGLLQGGMSINDIWSHIHRLDPTTSVEHTIIPLDILKDWEH